MALLQPALDARGRAAGRGEAVAQQRRVAGAQRRVRLLKQRARVFYELPGAGGCLNCSSVSDVLRDTPAPTSAISRLMQRSLADTSAGVKNLKQGLYTGEAPLMLYCPL